MEINFEFSCSILHHILASNWDCQTTQVRNDNGKCTTKQFSVGAECISFWFIRTNESSSFINLGWANGKRRKWKVIVKGEIEKRWKTLFNELKWEKLAEIFLFVEVITSASCVRERKIFLIGSHKSITLRSFVRRAFCEVKNVKSYYV